MNKESSRYCNVFYFNLLPGRLTGKVFGHDMHEPSNYQTFEKSQENINRLKVEETFFFT